MITNQIIQKCINTLKDYSKTELCVFEVNGAVAASTFSADDLEPESIRSFISSMADSQMIKDYHLFKVIDEGDILYVLVSKDGDDPQLIGRIAASELEHLTEAYKERFDQNNFFQNLLLDNMLSVDIYNQAKKFKILTDVTRGVFIIEPQTERESGCMELLRSLYMNSENDYVTAVDEKNIILVKSFSKDDDSSEKELESIARMLVDTMNTELMIRAKVAYGTVESDIKKASQSYKEAKMALEVGKVFYAERDVVGYNSLGIGRLVYQLQPTLCDIFLHEVFGEEVPESFDDETLVTVNKFFENNLNVSETSRQLFVHRNTLVYRIEKLEKATGLDIRAFDDALTLKIALMVMDYMRYIKQREY
ncbi:MAG: helix-turn-helix domain-containing protein [Lachnospiraceae bacterium]|nr:helix-turn-helix domain-containing protein [Lachnospiraceae bacterium]